MTYDLFEDEREIDEIRNKLYREMQELGQEEFKRRQAEKVREIAAQYGLNLIPSQSVRRPI